MLWLATAQPVTLLGERSLLLFEEDSELVVTHDEVTLKKSKRDAAAAAREGGGGGKCLLMDRKGQLDEANCESRRSFVCETSECGGGRRRRRPRTRWVTSRMLPLLQGASPSTR